jgi:hypothetical protein
MLVGLLRTVLAAVVIWWVWRILDRWVAGKKNPHPPRSQANSSRKPKPGKSDAKLGEYVDFEELKEE